MFIVLTIFLQLNCFKNVRYYRACCITAFCSFLYCCPFFFYICTVSPDTCRYTPLMSILHKHVLYPLAITEGMKNWKYMERTSKCTTAIRYLKLNISDDRRIKYRTAEKGIKRKQKEIEGFLGPDKNIFKCISRRHFSNKSEMFTHHILKQIIPKQTVTNCCCLTAEQKKKVPVVECLTT